LIRRELTDAQWRRIEQLVPGKKGDRGQAGEDNRRFVDAVLWLARAGAPWRDLPERVRPLEQRLPALSPMGQEGRVGAYFQRVGRASRL
jgi:transposase